MKLLVIISIGVLINKHVTIIQLSNKETFYNTNYKNPCSPMELDYRQGMMAERHN